MKPKEESEEKLNRQAVIIHGWGADSQSNWFPWLKQELENKGWIVDCPDFPNTQWPKLNEWIEYFDKNIDMSFRDASTVLIGHSLGVPFILRYLQYCHEEVQIKSSYLVAGFYKPLGFPEIDNFVEKPFDWKKIRKASREFIVINSDNDPYIPRYIGKELAKNLGVSEIVEQNGEHLTAPGGYLEYQKLLNLIKDN